jgi:hypothetical protein
MPSRVLVDGVVAQVAAEEMIESRSTTAVGPAYGHCDSRNAVEQVVDGCGKHHRVHIL